MDLLKNERILIVEYLKKMLSSGLGGGGTSGNISIYNKAYNLVAISPTGVMYDKLDWQMIPVVGIDGTQKVSDYKPSSELCFHLNIYKERNDLRSVVHTHSVKAAAFSTLGRELPPLHYIIGYVGRSVPYVPYSEFGGNELAEDIKTKIKVANGLILGNHGVVACGDSIQRAYACAEAIEFVAEIYLSLGERINQAKILTSEQMSAVLEKFKSYGQGIENDK